MATLRTCHQDEQASCLGCGLVAYSYLGLLEHQHRGGDGEGGSVTPSPWHSGFPFPLNLPLLLALSPGPESGSYQRSMANSTAPSPLGR